LTHDPEEPSDYIGTDESGKGDFFGPLVIAGVHLSPANRSILERLYILESKRITDKRALSLAEEIKAVAAHAVITIGPEKYNELYVRIKNLNRLLGRGHARAIQNILAEISSPAAISDQFGDVRTIEKALMERGRQIQLVQTPRAERFLAVAAASVLARAAFLNYLNKLSHEFDLQFPKGASAAVDNIGRQFIDLHGVAALTRVAKLHFKNSKKIAAT